MVSIVNKAIKTNKRVLLKSYHSINSQKITDRIIEPICLTDNYHSICGFEVATQTNKFYNLERITEVILLNEQQEFQTLHQHDETDVFGFSKLNGKWFLVELHLTFRAYVLLKETYPKVEKHIKKNKNADGYILKIDVNNPKPIVRFILGLIDEIEIIGSPEFKKYITTQNKGI